MEKRNANGIWRGGVGRSAADAGPQLIVALGATAARALLQRNIPIHAHRGKVFTAESGHKVVLTIHSAALLRMPTSDRADAYQLFSTICRRCDALEKCCKTNNAALEISHIINRSFFFAHRQLLGNFRALFIGGIVQRARYC